MAESQRMDQSERPSPGRAGELLTGLTSASGGLAAGADTLVGQILILASPLATVLMDYLIVHVREAVQRWDELRPIRLAKRTLHRAIDDRIHPTIASSGTERSSQIYVTRKWRGSSPS